MKCPKCAAWSSVLDTRAATDVSTKRRRKCANGHLFITFEVPPRLVRHDDIRVAVDAARKAKERARRDRGIVNSDEPASVLAKRYGISTVRVQTIRREYKETK